MDATGFFFNHVSNRYSSTPNTLPHYLSPTISSITCAGVKRKACE